MQPNEFVKYMKKYVNCEQLSIYFHIHPCFEKLNTPFFKECMYFQISHLFQASSVTLFVSCRVKSDTVAALPWEWD